MKRKLFALLILAALLLSLFPCAALAEEPEALPEETEETEAPAEEAEEKKESVWKLREDDVIYFGVRDDAPIAWLVLDPRQTNMGTEGVFLLTRDLYDSTTMVYDESSTLWEGSLAQQWCTDFAAECFSEAESALVPFTDKHEDDAHLYALTWRAMDLKQEQVFFLSVLELDQYFGSYGPDNAYTVKPSSMENYWWLRTPHYFHDDYHSIVLHANMIHDYLPYAPWAARPCINLSLQDAVFLLPAEDEGAPGPVELPEDEENHSWRVLAPLPEHSFKAETSAVEDGEITVQYTGADIGEGFMLSLLVRDGEGRPLSLRRLERPEAAEGTLKLTLADLDLPEGGSLALFCEQLGGPETTNYASPLQPLETALPEPEVPEETPAPEPTQEPQISPQPEETVSPIPAVVETPAPTPILSADSPLRKLDRSSLLIAVGAAVALIALLVLAVARGHSAAPVVLVVLLLLLALVLGGRRYGDLNPLHWFLGMTLRL